MDSRKNIVVTGGNTGIGLQTARALYGDGHSIIFGSRNEQKNEEAAKSIRASFPQSKGTVKWFKLDLSKRASIEEFTENVKKDFGVIDILVNNAGMMMNDRQLNESGIEMTMAVNHFGPFYLTYLLFPHIKKSKEARIINVSSSAHDFYKGSTVQDLSANNGWKSIDSYSKSKLANVQFTVALANRLKGYPYIKTMSLHPGAVDSDFLSQTDTCNLFKLIKTCCCCCFVDTQTGARTSLYLARQPFTSLRNGEYYDSDTSVGSINPLGTDKDQV